MININSLSKEYITNSVNSINNLLKYTCKYESFRNFNKTVEYNRDILVNYLKELNRIKMKLEKSNNNLFSK